MNHSTNSLKHTVWECKYHVVFIPKYRKKAQEKEDRRLDQLKMFE
jgi:putative transposase